MSRVVSVFSQCDLFLYSYSGKLHPGAKLTNNFNFGPLTYPSVGPYVGLQNLESIKEALMHKGS